MLSRVEVAVRNEAAAVRRDAIEAARDEALVAAIAAARLLPGGLQGVAGLAARDVAVAAYEAASQAADRVCMTDWV